LGELLDRLQNGVIDRRGSAVERRIAHRTLLSIAKTRQSPDTSIDVAAILDGRLRRLADQFAQAKGDDEDASWQRSMAALLRDDARLAKEIGKANRPEPAIPPGMPIGG
jgi:hypothetical protein